MSITSLENKKISFYILTGIAFFILLLRLFYLQIYKQDQYLRESERNRIREIVLQPTRGLFYDRNGSVMVDNQPSYSVYAIPFEVKKSDSILTLASEVLNLEVEDIKQKIKAR